MNALIEPLSFDVFRKGKQVLNNNDFPLETTRGDTLAFKVKIDGDTQDIETAYFTVKEDFNDLNAVFQLSLGNGISKDESEENTYIVRVSPAFANLLDVGSYYYDLQIGVNDDIYTLMKGVLRVGYDVTNTVANPLYDTSDATATAADVVQGKTAYVAGGKVTGAYAPTLIEKTITANGEYLASGDDADGYSKVTVQIQSEDKIAKLVNRTIETITTTDLYGITQVGRWVFYECTALTSVSLPEGVTHIGEHAFDYCTALKTVTIPSTISNIGGFAFQYGRALESITVLATTPPSLGNTQVFSYGTTCPIYVPAESVAAYKSATNWATNSIASRIQAIPE